MSENEAPWGGMRKERQRREEARRAGQFIIDYLYIVSIYQQYGTGTMQRSIASAHVTCMEGELLTCITGLTAVGLRRIAKNILQLQDIDKFPLNDLIHAAVEEDRIFSACCKSYKIYVKDFISDVKEKYKRDIFNLVFSNYIDRDEDQSKIFEICVHVFAGYFRMYPPSENCEKINQTTNITAEASSISTAKLVNNISINISPEMLKLLLSTMATQNTADNDAEIDPFPVATKQEEKAEGLTREGLLPEKEDIKRTQEFCRRIVAAINQGNHLDDRRRIGVESFLSLVHDSMEARSQGQYFHKTAAREFFSSSNDLKPFKRRRGEKIGRSRN
jgi:hypothetical protein